MSAEGTKIFRPYRASLCGGTNHRGLTPPSVFLSPLRGFPFKPLTFSYLTQKARKYLFYTAHFCESFVPFHLQGSCGLDKLFAETDGVAFGEEDDAVEGVGDDEDGESGVI